MCVVCVRGWWWGRDRERVKGRGWVEETERHHKKSVQIGIGAFIAQHGLVDQLRTERDKEKIKVCVVCV